MRRIGLVGALVGVVALISGCWAFGSLTREGAAPSPVVKSYPGTSPMASPWHAQSIVVVQLGDLGGVAPTADQLAAAAKVVAARLGAARVAAIPGDRLRIEIAEASDTDAVKRVATAPGVLQFVGVPTSFNDAIVEGAALPAGMPVQPLFDGGSVETFELGADQMDQPAIDIQLDASAADTFDDWAADHIGERFAITLDGSVVSAPVIRVGNFDGRAQISGDFDLHGTQELVAILKGGVLPVPAAVVTVCPATTGDCAPSSPSTSGPPGG